MHPYKPTLLPIKNLNYEKLLPLVSEASRYLSYYAGKLESLPNPNILLSPLSNKEAILSSKIEGTQATLTDIYEEEGGEKTSDEKKRGDIEEVINYRLAIEKAKKILKDKPLSLNTIKDLHRTLMKGVRGERSDPGNFRRHQVHIGNSINVENARFVPPTPNTDMLNALDNWEKFIHLEGQEALIQLSIIHAQFEIIHPFGDGNGRVGRMLIPIFLYEKKYLKYPAFYLSEFLENNRSNYYDHLLNITENNDWDSWIEFFLKGIIKQSKENLLKINEIEALYEETAEKIRNATHSQYIKNALDTIFKYPIINTNTFVKISKIPKTSVPQILNKLVEIKILDIRKGSGRRSSTYFFKKLINTVEGKNVI
jgi:Fic family protein